MLKLENLIAAEDSNCEFDVDDLPLVATDDEEYGIFKEAPDSIKKKIHLIMK